MNILFQSAQFILTPQDYQHLATCFYLALTLPQENVPYICSPKSVVFNTKRY